LFFGLAFSAAALARLWPTHDAMAAPQPAHLGVTFARSHGIHAV